MLTIRHITVDSRDPYGLAGFWSSVTGWPISAEDSPGDPEVLLEPTEPGAPELLFVAVPEAKASKNRWHLDLVGRTTTRDAEVSRIVDLGASVVSDMRKPNGRGWVVLTDPEGNEFCVEPGLTERS
jgi:predicted enzyme related to lactoylglutathione lyase